MATCNQLDVQRRLNGFYTREIAGPERHSEVPLRHELPEINAIEDDWNQYEEDRLGDLRDLPRSPREFRDWYLELHRAHRAEVAPFFEHLAERAPLEELAFYIGLEEQVDGRFDDVIALAQIGMSGDMKLALAENFWDEMGLGKLDDMHTIMFGQSTAHTRPILERRGVDVAGAVPAEALKNGNLLLMYALRRRYAPRLLGALTILEHTAPYRFSRTVRGLRRTGVPEEAVRYHELHVAIDANHGKQLIERVLMPLSAQGADVLREVCLGCLIRYRVAADYYRSIERVSAHLGLSEPSAAAA